jgi:uncharacterized protein YggE
MNRKLALVLGLVIVAFILGAGLTACSGTPGVVAAQSDQPTSISLNNQQTGIWVSGTGKVTVTPDIATLSLGITAQASTVAEAQSQAAAAMNKVMSALTSNGIDQKDIQTQYYTIQQVTTPIKIIPEPYPTPENPGTTMIPAPTTTPGETIQYQVANTVTVKVRAIDNTGSIIDAVAAAGGDLTRINSVTFSVDNPEQYYTKARQLAMNDAADKAGQLAKLAGVTLGKATYISESSSGSVYPMMFSGAAVAQSATTPISPGQTDITINVQLAYAIQ